ncbi:MAG: glycosyltransferase family 2 protein [Solirubrobacteraceae bacterium]
MSTVERPVATEHSVNPPELLVSVVIPCLDEEDTIERCVNEAREALETNGYAGEVIVVDNGSTDNSAALAEKAGARVVAEQRRGYGSAYLAGFGAARGRYVVMADGDLTYELSDIPRFVDQLEAGADVVIGDRMDNIEPGAMHWLHRYVGNPLLSGTLNLFFRTGVRDAHCGMRALRSAVIPRLDLRTLGMEFASEMVIRSSKEHLRVEQLAIHYRPREGESKLARYRDGWRHLRFLLIHSPTHLFVIPGAAMSALGALVIVTVIASIHVLGRRWDIHAEIAGSLLVIVGTQILALGLAAHAYGAYFMGERDAWFDRMRARFRLEHGLVLGGGLILAGLGLGAAIVVTWIERGFGQLSEERVALLAGVLFIVGVQIFFSSFLLSILGLRRLDRR